jgi:hypothetical protein
LIQATGKAPKDLHKKIVQMESFLKKFGLRRLHTYNKTEIREKLANYFKLIVVRHPFDRLVSGWRDKILHESYAALAKDIVKKYRKNGAQNGTNSVEKVTFPEFARFLRSTKNNDDHWISYDRWCQPCTIQWDAILKVETLDGDDNIILSRLGNDVNVSSLPVKHSHQHKHALFKHDKYLPDFAGVDLEDMSHLMKMYHYDLNLFGYVWDGSSHTALCTYQDNNTCC